MKDIFYYLLIVILLCGAIYGLSRLQMKGWLHEIERHLKKKFENKPFKTEEK